MEDQYDIAAKILIIGDSEVGKSCVLMRYIKDIYYDET